MQANFRESFPHRGRVLDNMEELIRCRVDRQQVYEENEV